MSFATTDERVHALRQSFNYVMGNKQLTRDARDEQIKALILANHEFPHSSAQQVLEDDLLEALRPAPVVNA